MFVAGVVCFPPIRNFINRKTGINLHGAIYAVAFVVLASIGVSLTGDQQTKQAQEKEIAVQLALQKRVAANRATAEAEFRDNKIAILADAQRLFDAGDMAGVRTVLARLSQIGDPDLVRLRDAASLVSLRSELKQNPTEERLAVIYTDVARIDPADTDAAAKAAEIKSRIAADRARVARAQEREQQIRSQFSGWDGSHPAVERAVKRQMKNPDSYKHVETRYLDIGSEKFTVFTRFSGTNSFNAVVTNTATAIVSPSGEVVSIDIR